MTAPRTQRPTSPSHLSSWRALAPILGVLAVLAGCEICAGKLYWSGTSPGYLLETHCEAADVSARPSVRVEVRTEKEGELLRGVWVGFARKDVGARLAFTTGPDGAVDAALGPGPWDVDLRLRGYRPAHHRLELPGDQACTLRFRLSIDPEQHGFSF